MRSIITRIRILSFCIFLFALLLVGKLYFLQVVGVEAYQDKADRQYTQTSGTIFNRGTIFFSDKNGALVSGATLQSGYIVAIHPKLLTNPENAYEKLSLIASTSRDTFLLKASKITDPYEEILKHVSLEDGKKIAELKISGLSVYKDRWRFYPGGEIASQTIGILGFKGDEYAGRYGLERQYEKVLERSEGAEVNFFAQIFSNIKKSTATTTENEGDIVTTIEPTVESTFENILRDTSKKWNSESIGGIIMNPANGEIYAMAVVPSFDPNNSQAEKDVSVFSNPLVENVYEMGSIIKPLTIAAGIDAGLITASSTYYDKGSVVINNKKISNFDGKERGLVTMQDVLSQSLNVGAAHVAGLLGNSRFTEYMYRFGLNSKTSIDLPNEGRNLVDNLQSPRDIEHATASFGQGIALTPITTIRALASLANGGVLVTPHLVKRIDYKLGYAKEPEFTQGTQAVSSKAASEVTRMMVHSVDAVLLDGKAKLADWTVAAKTGTAQIAKTGGGGYSDTEFLHSFVGFFPSTKPRFFIFLYMLRPQGAQYGSETLTLPFMDMVKFLANYYEVPPDR